MTTTNNKFIIVPHTVYVAESDIYIYIIIREQ